MIRSMPKRVLRPDAFIERDADPQGLDAVDVDDRCVVDDAGEIELGNTLGVDVEIEMRSKIVRRATKN